MVGTERWEGVREGDNNFCTKVIKIKCFFPLPAIVNIAMLIMYINVPCHNTFYQWCNGYGVLLGTMWKKSNVKNRDLTF